MQVDGRTNARKWAGPTLNLWSAHMVISLWAFTWAAVLCMFIRTTEQENGYRTIHMCINTWTYNLWERETPQRSPNAAWQEMKNGLMLRFLDIHRQSLLVCLLQLSSSLHWSTQVSEMWFFSFSGLQLKKKKMMILY